LTLPIEHLADTARDPAVRGFLHRPVNANGNGMVLTHGAGSNAQAPLLVALADALCGEGFTVLRFNLPYRQERLQGPPRPGDAARDRQGLRNTVDVMRTLVAGRIFLGGHSYGGRQSSMLAAEDPGLVGGLLLLSYPLHPPRKPEQLRTQHLTQLQTPALFVSGTRDPFGSIEELREALKLIPARTELLTVEGAGHDLDFRKKKAGGELVALDQRILQAFQRFFG